MSKYSKGTVFSQTEQDYRGTTTTYWKITGEPYKNGFSGDFLSYPVIKCNKNGKEFKETTGFSVSYIDGRGQEDGRVRIIAENVPEQKASTRGKEIGIKKRRIGYLEARIASDQKELEKLKGELE